MFEKVNPSHPDKIADRIAGAIVDYAYTKNDNPKIAVEVLIGHSTCSIIIESDTIEDSDTDFKKIIGIVERIAGGMSEGMRIRIVEQDKNLNQNQQGKIRCGDNGIFKGMPITEEERKLTKIAHDIYDKYPSDGKYIIDGEHLIICQSLDWNNELEKQYPNQTINPLGFWRGGLSVDSGATNRKLGSDMGGAVTGGGLHGKDLSKADVTLNIYAHLKAQKLGTPVEICCAIGDEYVDGRSYEDLVKIAREYIKSVGGFEKFAEWGILR